MSAIQTLGGEITVFHEIITLQKSLKTTGVYYIVIRRPIVKQMSQNTIFNLWSPCIYILFFLFIIITWQ